MSELVLAPGSLIAGRYRLEDHLGEGGMGTVWAAQHTVTRRSVAMKFLRDSLRARPDLRQRFLREAATASSLKHPNVVEIIDVFDLEDSSPVMVMELLRGETLGKKLSRDERLSMEETAALMTPVVSAVGTAHAHGIVHRDLKPENLFLEQSESIPRVKVLDFGIAKLTAEHYLERGHSALLTDMGSMLGTPCYMAPEQASGERPVDHRADIWSLGVILYECLSGTRPIEGENMAQVVARLMSAGIIPLERLAPELPPEVSAVVMQMLSRDPGRRPESLLEINKVLARHTRVRPPTFEAPSMARPPEPAPSKARVIASRDADPQGPTLLSTPAVGKSVDVSKPPEKSRRGIYIGGAVFVVALLALSLSRAFQNQTAPEVIASQPPPPAPLKGAVEPGAEPAVSVAIAAPSAAPPPSTAPKPALPSKPRAKVPTKTGSPEAKAKPATDDDTLFSGRK
jgi:eukaryotic-like serine/threonine-protein kinase